MSTAAGRDNGKQLASQLIKGQTTFSPYLEIWMLAYMVSASGSCGANSGMKSASLFPQSISLLLENTITVF